MITVSIISITLNNIDGLKKTVQSLQIQTCDNFELIVIDGNSTDGTKEYLPQIPIKNYAYLSEKDSGVYDAMNKGIMMAKNDYLIFLNAGDCLFNENVLSYITNLDSSYDIYFGDRLNDPQRQVLTYRDYTINSCFLYYLHLPHQTTIIRRSLFFQHGLYDTTFRIGSDHEFFVREIVKYRATVHYIPIIVSIFNMEGISSSREGQQLIRLEDRIIRARYYPLLLHLYCAVRLFLIIQKNSIIIFKNKCIDIIKMIIGTNKTISLY